MKRLHGFVLVWVLVFSLVVAGLMPIQALPIAGQHQVRPGETLYCIGRGYAVSPWAIAQANGLSVLAHLRVGQVLSIPASPWTNVPAGPACSPQFTVSGQSPALTPAPLTAQVPASTVYVVQRGDSLWRIAVRYGVTVTALKVANQLQSDLIFVGQQLLIPGLDSPSPTPDASPLLPTPDTVQATVEQPTNAPQPTTGPAEPTVSVPPSETHVPLPTPAPSETATVSPTATPVPSGDPLTCAVPNIAWSAPGQLLRGGAPEPSAFACLAAAGVDVLVDQRTSGEDGLNEPLLAQQVGLEYINLGIGDDTAPSPLVLRTWIDTVYGRLTAGQMVLVHDAAGRGRMGFWDAVYFMLEGASAESAINDRYLARALPFSGAKIGCADGGNGQVQALAEIGQALTGVTYYPQSDEYGTPWADCPRPGYMDSWDYAPLFP